MMPGPPFLAVAGTGRIKMPYTPLPSDGMTVSYMIRATIKAPIVGGSSPGVSLRESVL